MSAEPENDARASVEQLFRAHAGFVASFLGRLGLAGADVDDAVQEVFTVAYRKGGFTPREATARTWLGAIAVRVASTQRRSQRRRREELDGAAGVSLPSHEPPAHAALELRERMNRVDRALASLELPLRAVFVLYELEGEDCASIGASLEVPLGTVYSRLHNARKRFIRAHQALLEEDEAPREPRRITPLTSTGDRP